MKLINKYPYGGPILLQLEKFGDARGYFTETYNKKQFEELTGVTNEFVQDNQSCSTFGVLRGMHFQRPPYAQAKLVRVLNGAALDVVIDIRKNSPTYGKCYYAYLTDDNGYVFYVPRGFAHGFISLAYDTIFQYKCDNFYNKSSEGGISYKSILAEDNFNWNDYVPQETIEKLINQKDIEHPMLCDFDSPFDYDIYSEPSSNTTMD